VATVTAEFPPESSRDEIETALNELLSEYPQLARFTAYVEFLRLTGGAHIHNQDYSLGIYGFGGYLVTSFDEGLFLDKDRFFLFGETLYHSHPEPVHVFAFDLKADTDLVFTSPVERSDYALCAASFLDLLNRFASGAYPNQFPKT